MSLLITRGLGPKTTVVERIVTVFKNIWQLPLDATLSVYRKAQATVQRKND